MWWYFSHDIFESSLSHYHMPAIKQNFYNVKKCFKNDTKMTKLIQLHHMDKASVYPLTGKPFKTILKGV